MVDRRLVVATSAAATLALLSAAFDIRGALGGLLVLAFILLGPGFAISLLMGPMRAEARLLVALTGSIAIGTLTSLAMLIAGVWSTLLGIAALAVITQSCVITAMRRTRSGSALPHSPAVPTATERGVHD